jgi:hypothetical protein
MKNRLIVIVVVALAAAGVAASSNASGGRGTTLDLTGTITGFHVALDAKPTGESPGDIGYETGILYEHAKRVGRFQGVCTTLPQSSQQCSFILGLPGGQIVIESGYGPSFNTGSVALEAIVGGTGAYVGARGEGRDRELGTKKLAFQLELIR